jgi:hypothetical protein
MEDEFRIGSVTPRAGLSDIRFETPDGDSESYTGFIEDPEEPGIFKATRYSFNNETKETTVERGKIRGKVTEAGHFIWEHKKGAAAAASFVISVAIGSLWIKHRDKK